VQCSAVQCSAVQCSAVQCSAVQCSAVQCSAVQCSAVQCSAVQCSAVNALCSAVSSVSDDRASAASKSPQLACLHFADFENLNLILTGSKLESHLNKIGLINTWMTLKARLCTNILQYLASLNYQLYAKISQAKMSYIPFHPISVLDSDFKQNPMGRSLWQRSGLICLSVQCPQHNISII
jgi:hypothetical protein